MIICMDQLAHVQRFQFWMTFYGRLADLQGMHIDEPASLLVRWKG